MKQSKKKAVVLLSGGLDSAVTAAVAKSRGRELYPVSIDYGQVNQLEIDMAKKQSYWLCGEGGRILFDTITVTAHGEKPSSLMGSASKAKPSTVYVPGRNMMMFSHAAAYAESIGASEVWVGLIGPFKDKRLPSTGSDCSRKFLSAFQQMLDEGGVRSTITFVAPFISKSKTEVVKAGVKFGVPFENTWSCFNAGPIPCGMCPTCVDRTYAFAEAGMVDPLWGWNDEKGLK